MLRRLLAAALLLLCGSVAAQTAAPPPAARTSIVVVGVTPVDGTGVDADKYPANVQVIDVDHSATPADALAGRAASVTASESQANRFQPDLSFRGFLASPLLGTPQGIAVFQDGVRLNEPFGDVVNWDVIPQEAIASMQLIPGANAAFGLNALGGVVTLRTKTGFTDPGVTADLSGGPFGARRIETAAGTSRGNVAGFLALAHDEESGWRDFSPSRLDHLFGSLQRAGGKSSTDLRLTLAGTDLTGNGAAPIQLLDMRRAAVFTYPDATRNRSLLLSSAHQAVTRAGVLDVTAFFRRTTTASRNGDESPYEGCALDPATLCDPDSGEPLLDPSGKPIEPSPEHALDAVLNHTRLRQTSLGATGQWTRSLRLSGREHRATVGGTFDRGSAAVALSTELADLDDSRRAAGSGRIAGDSVVRLDATIANAAIFLTDVVSVTDRATITAALRANRSRIALRDRIGDELSGDHRFTSINPSIGVAYALTSALTMFASAGQSTRTPTPVELTCGDAAAPCRLPNAFVSDPPLAQVIARSIEIGARGRLGGAHWSMAGYRTDNDRDLLFISSGAQRGTGYFANIGRTRRAGIEVAADGSISDRFQWRAAWDFLDATFRDGFVAASPHNPFAIDGEIHVMPGDRLPLMPAHSATVAGSLRLSSSARLEATARYVAGSFFRGDEANVAAPLPGYVTADASIRFALTPRLALELSGTNVTNERYATFGTFGNATGVLGQAYDDPRFVSPAQPRAFHVVLRFSGSR